MRTFEDEAKDRLFVKLAEEIPENWLNQEELQSRVQPMLEDLKNSMSVPPELAAEMAGVSIEDVMESLEHAAAIYAKMSLFEETFPEIVKQLPKEKNGAVIYPSNVLSQVYGVPEEEAIEIFNDVCGIPRPPQ